MCTYEPDSQQGGGGGAAGGLGGLGGGLGGLGGALGGAMHVSCQRSVAPTEDSSSTVVPSYVVDRYVRFVDVLRADKVNIPASTS